MERIIKIINKFICIYMQTVQTQIVHKGRPCVLWDGISSFMKIIILKLIPEIACGLLFV